MPSKAIGCLVRRGHMKPNPSCSIGQVDVSTAGPLTRPPAKRRSESTADYHARFEEWERDQLLRHQAGWRALMLPPGVSTLGRSLMATVAQLSFARGTSYAPIELGERTVAAMLRLRGARARRKAHEILEELVGAGVLVLVESSRGRRAAQYRISAAAAVQSMTREDSGHKEELEGVAAADQHTPDRSKANIREERKGGSPPASPTPSPTCPQGGQSGAVDAPPRAEKASVDLKTYLTTAEPEQRRQAERVMGLLSLVEESPPAARARAPRRLQAPRQTQWPPPRRTEQSEWEARVRAQAAAALAMDREA